MEEEKRTSRRAKNAKELHLRRLALKRLLICCIITVVAFIMGIAAGAFLRGMSVRKPIALGEIKIPEWVDSQLISVNPYSRPGTKLGVINNIEIHYIANPKTTAQQNRNYFDSLKSQSGNNVTSVSSNFIVGLEGEVLMCVPIDEMAYASNDRNGDTISIENCHPNADGEFTQETYDSLVRLTAWLCNELDLSSKDVIRHYDITGKACPKSFVDNEDDWKQFRKDVKKAQRQVKETKTP